MKNKKLIIFDMDGVLVDACEWHKEALNQSLVEICGFLINDEEHYTKYNGLPTKVKLKKLSALGLLDEADIQKIEDLKQIRTIDIINKKAFKRQEKIELLQYLKSNNCFIACYTNSIRTTAELMLEKTGILNFFDLLITNQDVEKCKPDPEGYNKIINFFNLSCTDTLIVEDSPNGIEAATKSGAKVCIVKNPDEVNIELLRTKI
jgi:HAD superfamily hydrolase (TIGR01509 family)